MVKSKITFPIKKQQKTNEYGHGRPVRTGQRVATTHATADWNTSPNETTKNRRYVNYYTKKEIIINFAPAETKEEDHSVEHAPSTEAAIIKPNLNSIRKILGGDGTDQQRKVVEENTGLIPKYYKVIDLMINLLFMTF